MVSLTFILLLYFPCSGGLRGTSLMGYRAVRGQREGNKQRRRKQG